MCGLCQEDGTYDDEESPPAPENIFQQIDEKIDELKFKYENLAKKFEKKRK